MQRERQHDVQSGHIIIFKMSNFQQKKFMQRKRVGSIHTQKKLIEIVLVEAQTLDLFDKCFKSII